MISYITRGQPGGGGSRLPESTSLIDCVCMCVCVCMCAYVCVRACMHVTNLNIFQAFEWFVSKTPYLIEQTPIAPDITGSGVLLEINCFRGSPLYWNLSSL